MGWFTDLFKTKSYSQFSVAVKTPDRRQFGQKAIKVKEKSDKAVSVSYSSSTSDEFDTQISNDGSIKRTNPLSESTITVGEFEIPYKNQPDLEKGSRVSTLNSQQSEYVEPEEDSIGSDYSDVYSDTSLFKQSLKESLKKEGPGVAVSNALQKKTANKFGFVNPSSRDEDDNDFRKQPDSSKTKVRRNDQNKRSDILGKPEYTTGLTNPLYNNNQEKTSSDKSNNSNDLAMQKLLELSKSISSSLEKNSHNNSSDTITNNPASNIYRENPNNNPAPIIAEDQYMLTRQELDQLPTDQQAALLKAELNKELESDNLSKKKNSHDSQYQVSNSLPEQTSEGPEGSKKESPAIVSDTEPKQPNGLERLSQAASTQTSFIADSVTNSLVSKVTNNQSQSSYVNINTQQTSTQTNSQSNNLSR